MVARAIPGLGLGLNPYLDPTPILNTPDASQATMPGGSDLSNGIGSWLGALGMAMLSSPRNAPFASLPQIMPAIMQQAQQRAALQQQMKVLETGRNQLNGAGVPSLADILGGDSAPGAPPAPQYPDARMPGMSTGGAIPNAIRGNSPVDTFLNLTGQHESGWRNIMQQAVGPNGGFNPSTGTVTGPSSAQGYFQITNSTWKNFAPKAGVDLDQYPNAMQAPYDVQRAVAKTIATTSGVQHWTNFNPRLRAAVMSIGLPTSGPIADAPAPSAVPAVQYAQAGPQTMTDASPGLRPAVQMRPNPFGQGSQTDTAQYTPEEIDQYRALGIPLSPQSAQQAIQNKTGQMATAPGGVSPSYARGQDGLVGEVARTTPQVLPDDTSQRPAATAPGQGPTPTQYQQAQIAAQRPPPPSPDQVSGDLGKQRAAAIRYYEYYGDLAMKFAPFGEAGKAVADAAKQRMEIAKEVLTEGQKKRLEAQYAFPIAQSTASGQHAGALPYLPAEKQIEQQAQYYGPGADVALQGQLAKAKEDAAAAANMREHFATQQGATMVDPNNPAAGVAPIPNFAQLNAANKGAEAAAVSTANLPAQIGQATGSEYAKLSAEDIFKRRPLALDAAESLRQSQVARGLIDAGINTGPFAQWKQSFDRVLGDNNIASNTEAFVAARATEVGRLIKQFGSGTGLSDADREYAAQMAAGRTSLTKKSILTILDLNDTAARNVLQRYNQDAAKVPGGLVPYPLTVQPSQTTAGAPIVTPYGTIRQIR